MITVTLNIQLELDSDRDLENVLTWIAKGSVIPAIEDDWSPGGQNLAGYEGPLVHSITASYNGIDL